MNKQKAHSTYRPRADTLEFYSSLSLDEAIKCLETLPPEYDLKIITANADDCRFEIHYGNRRSADAAMGRGTLRRWEGTFTRVDFDGQILGWKPETLEPLETKATPLNRWIIVLILWAIGVITISVLVVTIFSPTLGRIVIVTGLVVGMLLLSGFLSERRMYRPYPSNSLDDMLGALEAWFTAAGIVADTPHMLTEQTIAHSTDHFSASHWNTAQHE